MRIKNRRIFMVGDSLTKLCSFEIITRSSRREILFKYQLSKFASIFLPFELLQ